MSGDKRDKRLNAIIIDSDINHAEAYSRTLSGTGVYNVNIASSAEQALEKLDESYDSDDSIDAVFIKGENGWEEIADRVKQADCPRIIIIFPNDEVRCRARELGYNFFPTIKSVGYTGVRNYLS